MHHARSRILLATLASLMIDCVRSIVSLRKGMIKMMQQFHERQWQEVSWTGCSGNR